MIRSVLFLPKFSSVYTYLMSSFRKSIYIKKIVKMHFESDLKIVLHTKVQL